MHIFITGGTGFVGQGLVSALIKKHHTITLFSRNTLKAKKIFANIDYSFMSFTDDITKLDGADAVINLAGEPIIEKRWTKQQKKIICHSRWDLTEKLTDTIAQSNMPPNIFISASAIGFYGPHQDEKLIESSSAKMDFGHQICQQWEQLALKAQSDNTRVCVLRIGIVLGKSGGALAKMLLPFKLGLGAKIGSGRQGMSWIHIQDMVNLIIFMLENDDNTKGVYNATAPTPVSNAEFSMTLASTLRRPCLFTTPSSVLTLLLGERADLLINGQFVYPQKALDAGFIFTYPDLDKALQNLL